MPTRKLKTIDLFSGCGGAALGLSDQCKVIAYCEYDKDCQSVLQNNQDLGYLDKAPIHPDVRTFPKLKQKVDLVSAGFPCQDISIAGNQHGLKGERSSLFHDAMKVVKNHKPPYVFLENVSNILRMPKVWKPVLKSLDKAGYDASWMILAASNLGAPHKRKRWFLLGTKRGSEKPFNKRVSGAKLFGGGSGRWNSKGWSKNSSRKWDIGVPRMINSDDTHATRQRLCQCGNICVPQQADAAFSILRNGVDWPTHGRAQPISFRESQMPKWGQMVDGELYEVTPHDIPEGSSLNLKFKQYKRPSGRGRGKAQLPTLHKEVTRDRYTTPRAHGGNSPAGTLTRRAIQDISNQLRFEKNTPTSHRWKHYPNPEYIEWMVGLPRGWTKLQ